MPFSNQSINQRLNAYELALHNALNDAALSVPLARYSYTAEKINAGLALCQAARQQQLDQLREYAEQYAATQAFEQAWKAADAGYMRLLKLGRILFKEQHAIYLKLGLVGDRKQSFSGWLTQARQFFQNVLEDAAVLAGYAAYNVPQAKIETALALVDAAEAAQRAQQRETGEAQEATQARDAALDAIDAWMSAFIAIARLALEDNPQLIEKLGILERS
jgi:hypothetical protein